MNKPVLFLDIDGVLNAGGWLPSKPDTDWPDLELHRVECSGHKYPLYLSKEMGSMLAALDVEIRWLTTWADEGYKVGDIIGLPENLEVAAFPTFRYSPWKWHAVRDFVQIEPGRPFVWIDDEAIYEAPPGWLKDCGSLNLAITTNPIKGIPREAFAMIDQFIESCRADSDA